MRRFLFGIAIASLTVAAPMTAFGGDREIADQIISTLKQQQSRGSLKGFDIDLAVEDGVVKLTGSVANASQAASVIEAAHRAAGVKQVISQIEVRGNRDTHVKPASDQQSSKFAPLTIGGFEEDAPPTLALTEAPQVQSDTPRVAPRDAAINDEALRRLGRAKANGELKNFDLDLSTVDAEVWVRGFVANAAQKKLVLSTVQRIPGVTKVIDDVTVNDASGNSLVKPASDLRTVQSSSMPVIGRSKAEPRAFAPSMPTSYDGGVVTGGSVEGMSMVSGMGQMPTPVPMNMGPTYGAGIPRYDQPQMPGYAWPSYAAYPNYAAVTYPKQYSASAWPYIGPFYPYPQVPLGWRKVALEWDDGLWYLDFTSK